MTVDNRTGTRYKPKRGPGRGAGAGAVQSASVNPSLHPSAHEPEREREREQNASHLLAPSPAAPAAAAAALLLLSSAACSTEGFAALFLPAVGAGAAGVEAIGSGGGSDEGSDEGWGVLSFGGACADEEAEEEEETLLWLGTPLELSAGRGVGSAPLRRWRFVVEEVAAAPLDDEEEFDSMFVLRGRRAPSSVLALSIGGGRGAA